MLLENMMYFVLGFIASGLLALMIMPAIWRRAERLTKKRIEAATPMTMSEFRADKDQLRAEFALSTRRLEMNVENLRKRLAGQLSEINHKRSEQIQLKSERNEQLAIIGELEQRESDLRRRILDLEKESTDLAQRLRMSERDHLEKASELDRLRARNGGVSSAEIDELLNALEKEREHSRQLEEQVERLVGQLKSQGSETASAHLAIAEMRQDLAGKNDEYDQSQSELIEAEARMANAESRLSELLQETTSIVEFEESRSGQLLAEKLSMEEEMNNLREKVLNTENTILNEWDSDRIEQSHLRERLNDIASDVSRLVYSVEEEFNEPASQSLFDRVQKFANDETLIVEPTLAGQELAGEDEAPIASGEGRLSARMRALRDVHTR